MLLINNLTIDEINAALIHLQRSRNEVVGGVKEGTTQNITINNQGSSTDYSSIIESIENRLTRDEKDLTDLDSAQRIIASQTAGLQEQVADIYNTLAQLSQNGITNISFDDTERVLTIDTQNSSYEVPIPTETVSLTLSNNVLTFTMGSQTQTVTLPYIPASEKGVAGGVATLDSSGRIPYSQLPESAMEFLGEWDASTNTPHLQDGTGTNGDFYVVSAGGTVNFGTVSEPRNITFVPNDRVVYEGSADQWFRLPAGQVQTVNGLSGDVVLNGINVKYDGSNNSPTLKDKIDSVETKAETQSDWNISDSTNIAFIKNKPDLKTVATSGSYNDLTDKPTIPAAQVQSDWTQTDSTKKDFIKNKIPIWITQGSASDNMQPVDTVQSGETRPVTSNGVANALDLPKDSVLHYSFDDVPDYPDGTAVYFRDRNFTSADVWEGSGTNQFTYPNGILTVASLTSGYVSKNITSGNIVKAIIRSSVDDTFSLYCGLSGTSTELQTINAKANVPIEVIASIPSGTLSYVGFHNLNLGSKFEILSFYIGNGSYTTPIIDNSGNGNNATNNGAVAVQGVSGKGAYFLNGKYAGMGKFNLAQDFTVSIWVKPDNATSGLVGNIYTKENQILLQNGTVYINNLSLAIRQNNVYTTTNIGEKLTANTWTHLVVTKNGATLSVYRNGALTTTATLPSTGLDQNDNTVLLGSDANTRPQSIDDLQIFSRALSEQEVTALYLNKANTPKYYDVNNYKLPSAPSTNGTYNLQCTVASGVPTYSWVSV